MHLTPVRITREAPAVKIISLTSAAIRIDGVAIALEKDAEVDIPDAKAKHLIKVGLAKAVETKAPTKTPTKPAETKIATPAEAKTEPVKPAETK